MLVIGNGESRKTINLDSLTTTKIGCNAIYRDNNVEHLVCVDKPMFKEVLDSNYNDFAKIHTRSTIHDSYLNTKNVRTLPSLPYVGMERPDLSENWGSGPYAVLLAATMSQNISLIGFDLYSKTNTVNNIYKGTKNYIAAEKSPIDPSYWIYQIGKIFDNYPKVKFTIFQEEGWQRPKAWKKSNVKVDNLTNI